VLHGAHLPRAAVAVRTGSRDVTCGHHKHEHLFFSMAGGALTVPSTRTRRSAVDGREPTGAGGG